MIFARHDMQGKSRFPPSRLIFWNTVKVNLQLLQVANEIDISHNLVMSYSVIGLGI